MLEKIKGNLAYTLCAFFGLFNFIFWAFDYLGAYLEYRGESVTLATKSGYSVMSLEGGFLGGLSSFIQILILILSLVILAIGVLGLLKAFGVIAAIPAQIEKFVSEKFATLGVFAYAGLNILLYIFLLIYAFDNTESSYGAEAGISLQFGVYFTLILSVGAAVALYFLGKKIPQGTVTEQSAKEVCPNCGAAVSDTDKFCKNCGASVEANSTENV